MTTQPAAPGATHARILAMAQTHGITIAPSALDTFGETIARLADNDLEHSDATRALIALRQANILSQKDSVQLLSDLLDEMGIA